MRFMNELLGQQQTAGLRNGEGRCAEMPTKQPAELPLTQAQTLSERGDRRAIERAFFHEGQCARDRIRRAAPGRKLRRDFRPAAQAWPKAGRLRRGRGRKEGDILPLRSRCRADRAAIDAGRRHAGKEAAVEARVTRADGTVAGVVIEFMRSIWP